MCYADSASAVVTGTVTGTVYQFAHTTFVVDDEIRMPFRGQSSGLQSSYGLTGFVACLVNRAHYFEVLIDSNG